MSGEKHKSEVQLINVKKYQDYGFFHYVAIGEIRTSVQHVVAITSDVVLNRPNNVIFYKLLFLLYSNFISFYRKMTLNVIMDWAFFSAGNISK
jgi:hypothetical protein